MAADNDVFELDAEGNLKLAAPTVTAVPELAKSPLESKTMAELSIDERYALADKFRTDGKLLFEAMCWEPCLKKWKDALMFVDHCITPKGEKEDAVRSNAARLLLYANLAAVQLKLGQYRETLAACKKALSIEPAHPKAIFRKGVAHSRLGNLGAARECFEHSACPRDGAVRRELQRLRQHEGEQQQRQRKLFLGKLAAPSSVPRKGRGRDHGQGQGQGQGRGACSDDPQNVPSATSASAREGWTVSVLRAITNCCQRKRKFSPSSHAKRA
eukprot:g5064.t1